MKVRAVAAPSTDSTAIGSIELECTPHGLLMVYLAVGAYREDYAPGAVTTGTRCVAAWPDVLDVRTQDDAILLSINAALTPHHKLYLKNFTQGDIDEHERKMRSRLLRGATLLMMLAVGFSLAASLPVWSPQAGQATALGLGIIGALAVLLVGLFAERLWLPPPPDSEALRQQLLAQIQHYRPAPVLAQGKQLPPLPDFAELLRGLPRSTTAVVIVLSAGSLAAVLTSSWIIDSAPTPRVAQERAPEIEDRALAAPPSEVHAAARPAEPVEPKVEPKAVVTAEEEQTPNQPSAGQQGEACSCERPDSVLWRYPFPRLSTLLISQRLRAHKEHHHVELELAVVNNGSEPLKEISLMVQFFEDNGKTPTKDRPLYYEARLEPGQAIKWHVEARGSSFLIQNPVKELLKPDEFASKDAIAKLLDANHRPVRLHGAMMLAYLDDARAAAGAKKLKEALREEEAPYLDRVLATRKSVVACDTKSAPSAAGQRVEFCVFNRGAEARDDIAVKVRGLDRDFDFRNPVAPPPVVITEKVFGLPGLWPPAEGHWVSVEVPIPREADAPVKTFEALVDQKQLLY